MHKKWRQKSRGQQAFIVGRMAEILYFFISNNQVYHGSFQRKQMPTNRSPLSSLVNYLGLVSRVQWPEREGRWEREGKAEHWCFLLEAQRGKVRDACQCYLTSVRTQPQKWSRVRRILSVCEKTPRRLESCDISFFKNSKWSLPCYLTANVHL